MIITPLFYAYHHNNSTCNTRDTLIIIELIQALYTRFIFRRYSVIVWLVSHLLIIPLS